MHHALYVEEILLHIFHYCSIPFSEWPSHTPSLRRQYWYANVHLSALARTCKTFKEPALDMIWADLNDLTPLVRCLPESSWTQSEGVYSLSKVLEQNEWDTILAYSYRVRALCFLYGSFSLDADSIRALSNPPSSVGSIFPNLRAIELHSPDTTIIPIIRHLAQPKLKEIWFLYAEDLGAAIEGFGEGTPMMTDFYVSEWAYPDAISALICRWKNLTSARCFEVTLNIDALSHLSSLRNLNHMAFKVDDAVVDCIPATQSSTSMLTFSALHSICLVSDSLRSVWRILRHFHLPQIQIVFVHLPARPTAVDLLVFSVALRDACTCPDSLNSLSMRTFNPENQSSFEDVSPYYITFDHLRLLTVFTHIKSLVLDIPCGADLNERELLCLASSWPHLEVFEVGRRYDWKPSSGITPGGLLQLLEMCRSLQELCVMLDTRGYTEIPTGHPWRGLRRSKATLVDFLNSPIEEESIEALGVFFHANSPCRSFSFMTQWDNPDFCGSDTPPQLCALYSDRWARVHTLALELWDARRDLRLAIENQVVIQ